MSQQVGWVAQAATSITSIPTRFTTTDHFITRRRRCCCSPVLPLPMSGHLPPFSSLAPPPPAFLALLPRRPFLAASSGFLAAAALDLDFAWLTTRLRCWSWRLVSARVELRSSLVSQSAGRLSPSPAANNLNVKGSLKLHFQHELRDVISLMFKDGWTK